MILYFIFSLLSKLAVQAPGFGGGMWGLLNDWTSNTRLQFQLKHKLIGIPYQLFLGSISEFHKDGPQILSHGSTLLVQSFLTYASQNNTLKDRWLSIEYKTHNTTWVRNNGGMTANDQWETNCYLVTTSIEKWEETEKLHSFMQDADSETVNQYGTPN